MKDIDKIIENIETFGKDPIIEKNNDIDINWIWNEYKRLYQTLGDDSKDTQLKIKLLENIETLLNKYKTILDEEKKLLETYSIYDILYELKNIFKDKNCINIFYKFLKELLEEIENEVGETQYNKDEEITREIIKINRKSHNANETNPETN
ncbi:MAG: hypothetical protein SNJ71_03075 [Bacteroidales bacterium]